MNNYYINVQSALGELLTSKKYNVEPTPPDTNPIFLILTTHSNLVSFALLDGNPEHYFHEAFNKFKELYVDHTNDWGSLDLSLVLCRTDMDHTFNEYYNKIEIDPYFCRKYVIDLNNLENELKRLPFMPLSHRVVDLERPINAQSILKKHGVNTTLARYLVVPHSRGKEGILEECLKGSLGGSEWKQDLTDDFYGLSHEIGQDIRLKELEINDFRVYRNQKFDFDADLVVLFGHNGFGKTSVFDAIDFVCTGSVGRFDERFGRKTSKLQQVLKHLDSSNDETYVKTKISVNGQDVTIKRKLQNRTDAIVDKEILDRTKTLTLITGLTDESYEMRIENLVNLFRASHLFGQEFQTLTATLKDNSRLEEDIVSRMLAMQDYVEAINKSNKVIEEIEKQKKDKEAEVNKLNISNKLKKSEFEELNKNVKSIKKPESITKIGRELFSKINENLDTKIEVTDQFNQETLRSWRSLITGQIKSVAQDVEIINNLETKLPEVEIYKKKIKDKTSQIVKNDKTINQYEIELNEIKKKLAEDKIKYTTSLNKEKNYSLRKEKLIWLTKANNEYEKINSNHIVLSNKCQEAQLQINESIKLIEKVKIESNTREKTIHELNLELNSAQKTLNAFNEINKNISNWYRLIDEQKEITKYLLTIENELRVLKEELKKQKEIQNAEFLNFKELETKIGFLQKSQSELENLLDAIQAHMRNNICPACGTSHNSRDELIEKLQKQKKTQPEQLQMLLKSFEEKKTKAEELTKQITNNELLAKQKENDNVDKMKALGNVKDKINRYEKLAASVGVSMTSSNFTAVINEKIKSLTIKLNQKQQDLTKQKSELIILQNEFSSKQDEINNLKNKLNIFQVDQKQQLEKIAIIREEVSNHQLSLEIKKEAIAQELIETDLFITTSLEKSKKQKNEIQEQERKTLELTTNKKHLVNEVQSLKETIESSKKFIEEVEKLLLKMDLSLDSEVQNVLDRKKVLKKQISNLELLQKEVTNFEISLDAAQVSGTIAKIKNEITSMTNIISDIKMEKEQLDKWLIFFSKIQKNLSKLQSYTFRDYTEKYGPLTTLIQKRLRSVYGFGDVRLHPDSTGLTVKVERGNERELCPSDYFSDSQIQILMLSLFLSAALTQTWSSFTPILMDDPVTHFDDLNAYSLLDLIKGLILDPERKQQFIISTCDDRLFRLMQQKFSNLDEKVIYYQFESLGENGPKIKRL